MDKNKIQDLQEALGFLDPRREPDRSHVTALMKGLGGDAYTAWERWTRPGGERSEADAKAEWDKSPASGDGVGFIFSFAESRGWRSRTQKRELGNTDTLIRNKSGEVLACEHNAMLLVAADARYLDLHYDDFLCRVRIGRRDWSDHDDRALLCLLQADHQIPKFNLGQVRNAVLATAYTRRLDSLSAFIRELGEWDGTGRIDHAFHEAWGAPDTNLVRASSRNFFISLIARGLRPGAQVDCLWAFEGPQGSRKSRSLRLLGKEFHAEISAAIGTTDFQRELRGIWIAELSELDSLRGREASTVKRLLSAPADRFVEKYQVHAVSYPRRAVAVATTNEAQYWQDPTGARRLVPVRTGDIRLELISDNREQWFAEALHRFQAGESWWEFPAEIAVEQEERQRIDPWEDVLRSLIEHGRPVSYGTYTEYVRWPAEWISSAEIMRDWLKLPIHQQGQTLGHRLGQVMRRLGYTPKPQGKNRERGWVPADTAEASVRPQCPPSSPSKADR